MMLLAFFANQSKVVNYTLNDLVSEELKNSFLALSFAIITIHCYLIYYFIMNFTIDTVISIATLNYQY